MPLPGSLLALLLTAGPALGAGSAPADRLRDVEVDAEALVARSNDALRNFTDRSGLIGVAEARERYKEAVYLYLLGDYEPAATSFYILVQSNALGTADLARDSEWYLGECLFERDDYSTAEEAYRAIVARGEAHPYFADAVRRSLEVYAITRDDAKFDEYYRTYIASGRVKPTDEIVYTLGKAFYRRGDIARARERFNGVAPGGLYAARSQYFLGVLALADGDAAVAMPSFMAAAQMNATVPEEKLATEIATLAVARLAYDTGDYATATVWYGKVPAGSSSYPAALRESVWTFVNQKQWSDAAAAVEVYLAKYPDDRYASEFQILRGHLGMKREAYDDALGAYEQVVSAYTPVADSLSATAADPAALRRYTAAVANPTSPDRPSFNIPAYAEEMLRGRDDVGRAVEAWGTIRHQQDHLAEAEAMIKVLEEALARPGDKLQNFLVARQEVAQLRASSLVLRNRALEAEAAWIRGRLPSAQRTQITDILRERSAITSTPASGPDAAAQEAAARKSAAARYAGLHQRLVGLRAQVADASTVETGARYDKVWASFTGVDAALDQAAERIDAAEARELQAVQASLTTQTAIVRDLRGRVDETSVRSENLAMRTMEYGVRAVADTFRGVVLEADKGIVDVFWLQKTEASDALNHLAVDLNDARRELDAQYSSLREGMK